MLIEALFTKRHSGFVFLYSLIQKGAIINLFESKANQALFIPRYAEHLAPYISSV